MNDRSPIRWLVLIVVTIALLNLPAAMSGAVKSAFREAARPLQHAVDSIFVAGRQQVASIGRIPGLLREVEDLKLELDRLEAERANRRAMEAENEELRRLLGLRPEPAEDWVTAKVLGRSRDGWWQTIRLNKGSSDGLLPDMPVVSAEGLIGKTVAVSRNTADVLLVSDPAFKVSSRLVRTGSFGVVSGRGPSWEGQVFCRMEFIHKHAEITAGDEVVTSGLGGVFPENLMIGYVDRVFMDTSGLYQYADVITRADLSRLRYVFVVRNVMANREPGAAGTGAEPRGGS